MARAKPNTIIGQFIPHRIEMLESGAWRRLSLAARHILDRLECEHASHGGFENGSLGCTYDDFQRFGVRRKSIAPALKELQSMGFVVVTRRGRGGNAGYRHMSRYRLTYLATRHEAPTDEWRRYSSEKGTGDEGQRIERPRPAHVRKAA